MLRMAGWREIEGMVVWTIRRKGTSLNSDYYFQMFRTNCSKISTQKARFPENVDQWISKSAEVFSSNSFGFPVSFRVCSRRFIVITIKLWKIKHAFWDNRAKNEKLPQKESFCVSKRIFLTPFWRTLNALFLRRLEFLIEEVVVYGREFSYSVFWIRNYMFGFLWAVLKILTVINSNENRASNAS
jgi:hypothetical protein